MGAELNAVFYFLWHISAACCPACLFLGAGISPPKMFIQTYSRTIGVKSLSWRKLCLTSRDSTFSLHSTLMMFHTQDRKSPITFQKSTKGTKAPKGLRLLKGLPILSAIGRCWGSRIHPTSSSDNPEKSLASSKLELRVIPELQVSLILNATSRLTTLPRFL
jgi:hypothetical protein